MKKFVMIAIGAMLLAYAGTARAGNLYWVESMPGFPGDGDVMRSNLDGTGAISLASGNFLTGLAIDNVNGKIYYTNQAAGDMYQMNLDGSGNVLLINGPANDIFGDIAVDSAGGKIYWGDGFGNLKSANLDGTGISTVLTGGWVAGVDIDNPVGKVYTSDNAIDKFNLDLTGESLVLAVGVNVWDVKLDLAAGKMYYTKFAEGEVWRANLDGTSNGLLSTPGANALGLALDPGNNKMYISTNNLIRTTDMSGGGMTTIVTAAGDRTINYMEVLNDAAVPEPSTYALGLIGLVGLGCVALRKKFRRA